MKLFVINAKRLDVDSPLGTVQEIGLLHRVANWRANAYRVGRWSISTIVFCRWLLLFYFRKKYTITCPDGTTRTVYHNIDHVFPLHLKHTKKSAEATASGLDKIKIGAKFADEDKLSTVLAGVDRVNQSIQSHFRAAYTIFEASPCTELPYFKSAVERIILEEQKLRAVETIVSTLCDVISRRSKQSSINAEVIALIDQRMSQAIVLLAPPAASVLAFEMANVPARTEDWNKDDE